MRASRAIFGLTLSALGLIGLLKGVFMPPWQSAPADAPFREGLAYLCDIASVAIGLGLVWQRSSRVAAGALLGASLLFMLLVNMRYIFLAPTVEGSYQNWGETAVIVAAAWFLYEWFATDVDKRRFPFAAGKKGLLIARLIYGLALIAFGLSHFAYLQLTAPLIPDWLPWHTGLAYFTGAAYLAAGVGLLVGVLPFLAALLVAVQMGLITVIVWVPLIASGHMTAFQWIEVADSSLLSVAGWVIADALRGRDST